MTPAQRQYDIDLAASMQRMAVWIEPRSRKVSDTLKIAAVRILMLAANVPDDTPVQLDPHGNKIQPQVKPPRPHAQPIKLQPASKPDEANKPNP